MAKGQKTKQKQNKTTGTKTADVQEETVVETVAAEEPQTEQQEAYVPPKETSQEKRARKQKEAAKQIMKATPQEQGDFEQKTDQVEYPPVDREITIHVRRITTLLEQNDEIPDDVKASAILRIGSAYKGRVPVKGISKEEQDVLLPKVLESTPGSPDYSTEKKNYFYDKTVEVGVNGVYLRIGKAKDGTIVPLEDHIEDYITYKWLQDHPEVGDSKKEAEKNPTIHYYIYDPEEDMKDRVSNTKTRRNAYIKGAEVEEDEHNINTILKMFPEFVSTSDIPSLDSESKKVELWKIIEARPEEFLQYANDEDLPIRSEIEEMVHQGILERDNNMYFYGSDTLGNSQDKVVALFKSSEYGDITASLRKKLEAKRNEV